MIFHVEFFPQANDYQFALWVIIASGEVRPFLGWEVRPNYPAGHKDAGLGGAWGVILFGVWVGVLKVRK